MSRALSNRHTCWQHCCPVLQAQTDRLSIPAMCSPVAPLSDLGLAKHAPQAQLILLDLLLAGLACCTRGAVGLGVLHGRETQCAQEHCGAHTPLWPQLSNLWRHPTLQKLQVWQAVRRHTGALWQAKHSSSQKTCRALGPPWAGRSLALGVTGKACRAHSAVRQTTLQARGLQVLHIGEKLASVCSHYVAAKQACYACAGRLQGNCRRAQRLQWQHHGAALRGARTPCQKIWWENGHAQQWATFTSRLLCAVAALLLLALAQGESCKAGQGCRQPLACGPRQQHAAAKSSVA